MPADADLAAIGSLLGDRTRASILMTLMRGDAQPASVLADQAGVSPSLASSHLKKLAEGGLIIGEARGRQRLYRLRTPEVAQAIESVMVLAPAAHPTSLREVNRNTQLRRARLCYDHLAGVFGVHVTSGLVDAGALRVVAAGFDVVDDAVFAELGIVVPELRARRRPLCLVCQDWTERRDHLAGALGAAVSGAMLERGWITRRPGTRALEVTAKGEQGVERWLGRPLAEPLAA